MNECIQLISKVDIFGIMVVFAVIGFCIGLLIRESEKYK